jgi:hypothetical protein
MKGREVLYNIHDHFLCMTTQKGLVVLSFAAFGQGTSPISLSNVLLLDSSLSDISFTSNDGSVNVSGNVVAEPGTMLLLSLGLVGLAGVRRKFKSGNE